MAKYFKPRVYLFAVLLFSDTWSLYVRTSTIPHFLTYENQSLSVIYVNHCPCRLNRKWTLFCPSGTHLSKLFRAGKTFGSPLCWSMAATFMRTSMTVPRRCLKVSLLYMLKIASLVLTLWTRKHLYITFSNAEVVLYQRYQSGGQSDKCCLASLGRPVTWFV